MRRLRQERGIALLVITTSCGDRSRQGKMSGSESLDVASAGRAGQKTSDVGLVQIQIEVEPDNCASESIGTFDNSFIGNSVPNLGNFDAVVPGPYIPFDIFRTVTVGNRAAVHASLICQPLDPRFDVRRSAYPALPCLGGYDRQENANDSGSRDASRFRAEALLCDTGQPDLRIANDASASE